MFSKHTQKWQSVDNKSRFVSLSRGIKMVPFSKVLSLSQFSSTRWLLQDYSSLAMKFSLENKGQCCIPNLREKNHLVVLFIFSERREAFVTLATNDTYSLGCLVLGSSLRGVGTTRQLVCMITEGVSNPMRWVTLFNLLQSFCWKQGEVLSYEII